MEIESAEGNAYALKKANDRLTLSPAEPLLRSSYFQIDREKIALGAGLGKWDINIAESLAGQGLLAKALGPLGRDWKLGGALGWTPITILPGQDVRYNFVIGGLAQKKWESSQLDMDMMFHPNVRVISLGTNYTWRAGDWDVGIGTTMLLMPGRKMDTVGTFTFGYHFGK